MPAPKSFFKNVRINGEGKHVMTVHDSSYRRETKFNRLFFFFFYLICGSLLLLSTVTVLDVP